MIAGGVFKVHLKDATYPPPLVVEEFFSVGNALMLALSIIGPKPKELGGERCRGGLVRHTFPTSIKAVVRIIMKWN